jgi:hypothetical protein
VLVELMVDVVLVEPLDKPRVRSIDGGDVHRIHLLRPPSVIRKRTHV